MAPEGTKLKSLAVSLGADLVGITSSALLTDGRPPPIPATFCHPQNR